MNQSQNSISDAEPANNFRCPYCKIGHAGLCGALSAVELAALNQIAARKTYAAGETILTEEQPITGYANIIAGMIKLTKTTMDGREQIVAMLFASDFFGRVYGDTSHTTATAVTDLELCTYLKGPFEQLLHNFPEIEHRLFEDVLDELDAAQEWMLLLGRKNATEKVASLLLMLEKRLGNLRCPHHDNEPESPHSDAGPTIYLPMTRSDMADYLGLTTETVCRQMTYLKRDGAILLPDNHNFAVTDIERLRELAGF